MTSNFRREIKFVLNQNSLAHAVQWVNGYAFARKKYQDRVVNSLYFDDLDYTSVKDNLSGNSNRSKYRLRWYGSEFNSPAIFEIKNRVGRVGSKESYKIESLRSFSELNSKEVKFIVMEELASKGVFFRNELYPTLLVSYNREYFETLNSTVRITIDKEINFFDLNFNNTLSSINPIRHNSSIMEIKFNLELMDTVSSLIKPLRVSPSRHSKYLVGLSRLGYAVYI
jgi:SPX domain protein involved in polyphosphate accumulation